MPAAAKTAESAPDQLEVYQLRDDLAHSYNPANAHERMLVTQIAQAWIRLQRAYDAERRYFEGRDSMEIIATKLDEFKAITRYVTDCERAWRHSTLNLEKSQRRRERESPSYPNMRRNPRPEPHPAPERVVSPGAPPVTEIETPKRE